MNYPHKAIFHQKYGLKILLFNLDEEKSSEMRRMNFWAGALRKSWEESA